MIGPVQRLAGIVIDYRVAETHPADCKGNSRQPRWTIRQWENMDQTNKKRALVDEFHNWNGQEFGLIAL